MPIRMTSGRELDDIGEPAILPSSPPMARTASPRTNIVLAQPCVTMFYDLDTPITLGPLMRRTHSVHQCLWITCFDLVLSYGGGRALDEFRTRLGARNIAPLYGHLILTCVDPAQPLPHSRSDLSYIGTYSEDRQQRWKRFCSRPPNCSGTNIF